MTTMLGPQVEKMVMAEMFLWCQKMFEHDVLSVRLDIHVVDDLPDIAEVLDETLDDGITQVFAVIEFDEYSVNQFEAYLEDLEDRSEGVTIRGFHPDQEDNPLMEISDGEGHVADDYAIVLVHPVTSDSE